MLTSIQLDHWEKFQWKSNRNTIYIQEFGFQKFIMLHGDQWSHLVTMKLTQWTHELTTHKWLMSTPYNLLCGVLKMIDTIHRWLCMRQVMKVGLSSYLVLLSLIAQPGYKTTASSWPDPDVCFFSPSYIFSDINTIQFFTHTYIYMYIIFYPLSRARP